MTTGRDRVVGAHAAARLVLASCVIFAVGSLATLCWAAGRGFDVTDEGYYLNVTTHPESEVGTLLWFGYVYHDLFSATDYDVVLWRRLALIGTVLLAGAMVWSVLGLSELAGQQISRPVRLALAITVGTSSLLVFAQLPLTPSYNTLALHGLMLVVIGFARVHHNGTSWRWAGWVCIGVGSLCAGLGKPTTAVVLLPLVVAFVLITTPLAPLRGAMLSVGTVLAGAGLLLLRWGLSPIAAVDRVATGLALAQDLGGHDSLLRWDPLHVPRGVAAIGLVLLAGAAVSTWGLRRRRVLGTVMLPAAFVVFIALATALAVKLRGPQLEPRLTYALTVVTMVSAGVVVVFGALTGRGWGGGRQRRVLAGWVLVLSALPLAFIFGTNTNSWSALARASIFWWLLAAVLCHRLRQPSARTSAAVGLMQLVAPTALAMSFVNVVAPYRDAPLSQAQTVVAVGPRSHSLVVSDQVAPSWATLLAVPRPKGSAMVDLTGASPGLIWLLGAVPVGQGWIIGGYSGSETAARAALARVSCDQLRAAWLITTKDGPRRLDLDVAGDTVARSGRYVREAMVAVPRTGWLSEPPGVLTVELQRPLEIAACRDR